MVNSATFPLVLVFLADLYILCSGSVSHLVRFYSFMFLHKILVYPGGLCKWQTSQNSEPVKSRVPSL